MELALITTIPFAFAAVIALPALRDLLGKTGIAWGTSGMMAALFMWLLALLPRVTDEGAVVHTITWVADLGLSLSFYLDGLSLAFGLLITGIGAVVFLYAGYYFDDDVETMARFVWQLMAFAGAMLALVLAGNVLALFVAWELTSITSFLLIGFKGDKYEDARVSASRALIITGGGGLAMLVGLLLLAVATNETAGVALFARDGFELSNILSSSLADHRWYSAITVLLMLGAFTKSAQFPFHFWLPGAMTAPSPASAYLHSATMVKAGVYLLFRFYPTLGDTSLWQNGLMGFGLMTMFIGALLAVRQHDLKGLLAYTTVSSLGTLVALIGLPGAHGLKAALVTILAHGMYKGTFFLLAGVVEHATGTRNLDDLGGLRRLMPGAFAIAVVVGLSMAGFPPLLGFVAKELLLDAMLPEGAIGIIPIIIAFVASVLTGVAALLFVWDVFVSRPDRKYDHFHAPAPQLLYGPGLLALLSLVTGLTLAQTIKPIITPAVPGPVSLYLFPPGLFEVRAFQLSVAVLVLGPLVFMARGAWLKMPWPAIPSGQSLYAASIAAVERTGDLLLKLQGGRLRYYLIVILGVVAGMMFFGGYDNLRAVRFTITSSTDLLRIMLLFLTVGGTVAAIWFREHLLAALAMGVSGYAVGGLFLVEPAPDVALVQFLVETLTTVLIILMIARIRTRQRTEAMRVLWKGANEKNNLGIWRDLAISVVIGVSVGLFALAAVRDRDERIATRARLAAMEDAEIALLPADWYLDNAYPEAGVTDVVSAILADFRGTDTLLEISVFGMAALGVLTLLTLPRSGELLSGARITQLAQQVTLSQEQRKRQKAEDERDTVEAEAVPVDAVVEHKPDSDRPTLILPRKRDEYGAFGDKHALPRLFTPLTRIAALVTLPFAMLISATHILYGGGGPGDGFTAGVVSGLAVALWYVVFGYFEARARLAWLHPGRLVGIGLSLAILNALAGLVFSDAFFRLYDIGSGKGPAGLHLASTLFFEFSIFLTVFGSVATIMAAIAHPEEVEPTV